MPMIDDRVFLTYLDPRSLGLLAAAASAFSWALGSVLYKRIGESVTAPGMNLVKNALSAVLLLGACAFAGFTPVSTRSLLLLSLSGVLGIGAGDTFFFAALQRMGASALVTLSMTGQITVVLCSVAFLGESPSPLSWAGIGLVPAGVMFALYKRHGRAAMRPSGTGLAYGALSVIFMTAAVLLTKMGIAEVPALQATAIRMLAGLAGLLCAGLFTGKLSQWSAPFADLGMMRRILFAVLVSTVGGFWLYHVALKHSDASLAVTVAAIEPLLVLPLAAAMLKEKITWRAVTGVAVAFAGTVCIFWG